MGLHEAGFDVVGVDIEFQPHYPQSLFNRIRFIQADALRFPLSGFDFIWASPPCQAYTALRNLRKDRQYPELIEPVRARLQQSRSLFVIENVPGAPLGKSEFLAMLCGTMFGLAIPSGEAELRRHRFFESNFLVSVPLECQHGGPAISVCGTGLSLNSVAQRRRAITVTGHTPVDNRKRRTITITGATPQTNVVTNQVRQTYSVDEARFAMGIDWMPMSALSQAIPPAYAKFIGQQALQRIQNLESGLL
jgi:DNA (cytosine-5)-methyltransferase 1